MVMVPLTPTPRCIYLVESILPSGRHHSSDDMVVDDQDSAQYAPMDYEQPLRKDSETDSKTQKRTQMVVDALK